MMHRMNLLLCLGLLLLFGCSSYESPLRDDRAAREAPPPMDGVRKVAQADRKPTGNAAAAPAADKPTPRKIIYTGVIDLIVDDFDKAELLLRQLVEEHKGYLANS